MIFSPSKVDIFTKELAQISTYFLPIDREVSQKILTLDHIVQAYSKGENVLQTKTDEIEEVRRYITDNRHYLSDLGFKNYDALMDFIAESYEHREELYLLLWKNQPFNYLVLLQNGNEKRPNGGFFGSFAFVTLEWGHLKKIEIVDSYLPDYIAPNARIELPYRFVDIFNENQVGFIAGNKFWFTDMDGRNIKILFERMFNQEYDMNRVNQMFNPEIWETLHDNYIKGVIFLDSRLVEELLPGFVQRARERQFINASIDIIRGEVRSNKKEIYIQNVMEYFNNNKTSLIRNLVNSRELLLQKRYINVYLSNVTTGLNNFLIENDFSTIYSPKNIYTRDINTSNNKSDAFISKEVNLFDQSSTRIFSTQDDIIPIADLTGGTYTLQIEYDFLVPENYINFIRGLEKQYQIKLTPREEDILVLWPVVHENKPLPRRRETRGTLYFWHQIEILNIRGDISSTSQFTSDFSKGLLYRVSTNQNHSTIQVLIDFQIHK